MLKPLRLPPLLPSAVVSMLLVAVILVVPAAPASAAPAPSTTPTWSEATTLGQTGRESGAPDIAVAPNGEAIAAWVGKPNGIEVSTRRPGQGWSPSVTIARTREEVEGPEVAVSAGKAVIVWSDNIRSRSGSARVVLAATRLRGKAWSKPRNISREKRWREEPEGREPQVAITRGGKAIAIWQASDEGHSTESLVKSATQAASGTGWSAPVGIRGSYEAEGPQVSVSSTGEAVAIWGAAYDEESSISVSSRPPDGPWKGGGRLGFPGPFPDPQIATTSTGEAIAVWVKEPEDAFGGEVQVATRPAGSKWKVKTLDPRRSGGAPEIVTEPGGRATVVWVEGGSFEEQSIVASTHVRGGGWSAPVSLTGQGLQLPVLAESRFAVTAGGEWIGLWAKGSYGEATAIEGSNRPRGGAAWSPPTSVFQAPSAPVFGAPDLKLALAPSDEATAVWRCFDGSGWVIKSATRPAGSASS